MKPMLGWTMLSREEMRQVERSLANSDQDTRDEIGFLLIHQGFADRFFPGTSVLHTRIRYALFVPWTYQRAAFEGRPGSDLDARIRHLMIELAIRLKRLGEEEYDVIGGDKLGQLTSQPPDRAYWTALRVWGILLPAIGSRSEALRRLQRAAHSSALDDDGGLLEDETIDVFAGLPEPPEKWKDADAALCFEMPRKERDFLRDRLRRLTRSGDNEPSLLARLVEARVSFNDTLLQLPTQLDDYADAVDKSALGVARDAAALVAIGRAVYGALLEELIAGDGGPDVYIFRKQLHAHFEKYGEAAANCDLQAADEFLPELPPYVKAVLSETQRYVRSNRPEDFPSLLDFYQTSEVKRKSSRRARLLDTERAAHRRAEWKPHQHNISPLHYRWKIVRKMLNDLNPSQ